MKPVFAGFGKVRVGYNSAAVAHPAPLVPWLSGFTNRAIHEHHDAGSIEWLKQKRISIVADHAGDQRGDIYLAERSCWRHAEAPIGKPGRRPTRPGAFDVDQNWYRRCIGKTWPTSRLPPAYMDLAPRNGPPRSCRPKTCSRSCTASTGPITAGHTVLEANRGH